MNGGNLSSWTTLGIFSFSSSTKRKNNFGELFAHFDGGREGCRIVMKFAVLVMVMMMMVMVTAVS